MAAFRKGERVRLAAGRSCARHGPGTEGIITYVPERAHWVGVRFNGEPREFTPNPARLVRVIDWTLPIELNDGTPLIVVPSYPGASDHFVEIRRVTPGPHPAFPNHPCNGGTARRDGGLVISNHKFYVRNREPQTMPKFKIGDRVVYVGRDEKVPETHHNGRTGTISKVHPTGSYEVTWDDGKRAPMGVLETNLELIMTLDTTKELVLPGLDRTVTFVTETSDGHILVDVSGYGWAVFDKSGKFVRAKEGYAYQLGLQNKVVEETVYVRLNGVLPRFESSVHCTGPTGNSVACLKVTMKDGIVSAVELARPNVNPFTAKPSL